MNRKGVIEIMLVGQIALGLIGLMAAKATLETAQNGVLKNNGKLIWCKVMNRGNEYCDGLYK